jgi:hypothetical protein
VAAVPVGVSFAFLFFHTAFTLSGMRPQGTGVTVFLSGEVLPALVSLSVGVAVIALARRDLAGMTAGRIDPEGRRVTAQARDGSRVAVVMSLGVLLLAALLLLL